MHLLLYFFFLLSFFRLQPPGEACTDQMSFSWKRDLHLLVGAGIWRGAAHHIRPVLPQRKVGGGTRRLSRFRLVLFWVELTLRGKRRKKKNKLSVRCSSTFHFVKNVTNDENVSCHSVKSGRKTELDIGTAVAATTRWDVFTFPRSAQGAAYPLVWWHWGQQTRVRG